MRDIADYSLLQHNTFGIDVKCRRFLEYGTIEEAQQVASILRDAQQPYIVIGGGCNLLFTKDYDGIVVHSAIKGIKFDDTKMLCGSGEEWDDVVVKSLEKELYGLENLSLIPGEVGASAVQNIGAYGVDAQMFIKNTYAVEIATGNISVLPYVKCQYGYRDSRFKHEWKNKYLICAVEYELTRVFFPRLGYGNIRAELERRGIEEEKVTASQVRDTIIDIRNSKLPDPKVLGNAGSFFVNPVVAREKFEALQKDYPDMPHYLTTDETKVKIPAGWMIEQCGWKGKSLGRAGVHSKQALVLVNRGGATGKEIVELCNAIRVDVFNKFGIMINPEVNII